MSSDRVLVDPAATHDLGLRLVRAARTLDRLLPELTSLADQIECSAAPTRLAQVREAARATGSDLTWLADEVLRADGGGEFTVPGGDLRTARLDAQRAEWCPDEQVSPRNHLGEFFGGAIDSIRATGDQINALTFDLFFDPQQWATNWNDVGNAALHSVTNPGDLYHAVVDPELFWENPARWAGSFAPDAIGVALGGSSVAARTTRSLDRVDVSHGPRTATPRSRPGELSTLPLPQPKWGRPDRLEDHVRRHGADVGADTADEYVGVAVDLLHRARDGQLPTKVDGDGVIRVYDPSANWFAAYNPDGTIRTLFAPTRGPDYWDAQPGRYLSETS